MGRLRGPPRAVGEYSPHGGRDVGGDEEGQPVDGLHSPEGVPEDEGPQGVGVVRRQSHPGP